ncbi:MAG: MFS transporter [Candidatus Aenigmatarchaeota archaeon]
MQLPEKKLDRALKDSIKDGASYSAMDGITSTYATPFALAMGANNAQVGFLNSIPSLFSTLLQPFIGRYIERMGRKDVCESLSFLQKLLIIPIIFIPMFFLSEGIFIFILLATLSNVILSFANTAWSSWIGNIVPEKIRGSYFGKRSMISSAFSFSTTLLGGWILGLTDSLLGFSFIFFMAFIFGLMSYFYLTKIPDVRYRESEKIIPDLFESVKDSKKYRNFNPFKNHMALVNFAVNLSSPFFTVYMLSVMNIGYQWYGLVVASEVLAKILMQRYWGVLSDKFGDRSVMGLCNIMIVFYPFLFLFASNPFLLILVAIFSGIAWSGFDLTAFNYLLDVTPPDNRSSYISSFKITNGMALFLGPFIGGLLSQYLSSTATFSLNGLQVLFVISFVLRGVVTAYGLPKLREARARRIMPARDVFLRTFAYYPLRGITNEIMYVHSRIGSIENSIKNVESGISKRFNRKKL